MFHTLNCIKMKVCIVVILLGCWPTVDTALEPNVEDGDNTGSIPGQAKPRGQGFGHVYTDTRPSLNGFEVEWDPNGYLFFCLAMGRIGNQMEHFLGSLAFSKAINRTLVLPPIRTYRNVRFTEWYKFEPLLEYHRVILAEDFMEYLAPDHWPPGKRIGYCFSAGGNPDYTCTLKEGYPFKPFWDGLNVEFDRYDFLDYSYLDPVRFAKRYPGSRYPVLALRGAPASYPMNPAHWPLQRHLVFSERIENDASEYIREHFPDERFVGIHLRNGEDWANACKSAKNLNKFMASPQCLHGTNDVVTSEMCLPSVEEILRLTKDVMDFTKARVLFVATDKNPMIKEFTDHLQDLEVRVYHMDPHLPLIDQAILLRADYFVANCLSSFSSYVTRARSVTDKPTTFLGYD